MKKLIRYFILMFVGINVLALLGKHFTGEPFRFDLMLNVVSPVVAAFTAREVERRQARQH